MATEPATEVHSSFVEKRQNSEAAGKHTLAASRQLKRDEPSKHEQTQRNLRPVSPSARSWCEPAHWVAPPTGTVGKAQP